MLIVWGYGIPQKAKNLDFNPFQGYKAKKKMKYGSKFLELSNSARNAEIAKKNSKSAK